MTSTDTSAPSPAAGQVEAVRLVVPTISSDMSAASTVAALAVFEGLVDASLSVPRVAATDDVLRATNLNAAFSEFQSADLVGPLRTLLEALESGPFASLIEALTDSNPAFSARRYVTLFVPFGNVFGLYGRTPALWPLSEVLTRYALAPVAVQEVVRSIASSFPGTPAELFDAAERLVS